MKDVNFLYSPYLVKLPLGCISKEIQLLSDITDLDITLLLDIISNKSYLVDNKILTDISCNLDDQLSESFFSNYNYYGVEIEINTNCNHKCKFCPVAYNKQSINYMSMHHFKEIILEVASCDIKNISLNHYSEPTLHPKMVEMISFAVKQGLSITLFTNGSKLSLEIIDELVKFKNSLYIVINFPESDADSYRLTTQSNQFSKIVSQIFEAMKKLPLKIVVNNQRKDTTESIKKLFPNALVQYWETDSRAGNLEISNYITTNKHSSGLLNGCSLAARFINISFDGNVFLCAQDFYKTNVFGNIHNQSLKSILKGDIAQQFRKWIFGAESPPNDFICRQCRWTECKKPGFSIGPKLSTYDLEVYSEIVNTNDIMIVTKSNDSIQNRLFFRGKNVK